MQREGRGSTCRACWETLLACPVCSTSQCTEPGKGLISLQLGNWVLGSFVQIVPIKLVLFP